MEWTESYEILSSFFERNKTGNVRFDGDFPVNSIDKILFVRQRVPTQESLDLTIAETLVPSMLFPLNAAITRPITFPISFAVGCNSVKI